jgi:hypothetical protein
MLRMRARLTVSTGRAIFMTVSSWGWVRGPTGAIATAGAGIASAAKAEAATAADLATSPITRAAAGAV